MESSLIKNRDFVIFGLQPWDIPIGSNCKNIALEISKNNRVLYVNRPLDRVSSFRNDNKQTKSRIDSIKLGSNVLSKINNQLWVFNPRVILESINFLPPGFFYRYLNKLNNKRLAKQIQWGIEQLNLKDPILIIDEDFFNAVYLKEFLKPSLFVYYIRDFLLSQKYFSKHGKISEPAIIKKADAVAANSQYLANYGLKYNPHTKDIGQGCDVEDFLYPTKDNPRDIINIPSPILGYCGSLTATRLDVGLIHFIAVQKPKWNIVLVGPEDDIFKSSALHYLKNIYFLGAKQPEELPAYTHSFDVCFNPQLINAMTVGNYPRKVDEYLAAGKPVVATKTDAMIMFEPNVYLCTNKDEYLNTIELALEESKDQEKIFNRKEMAKSHTWEASVMKLYDLIIKIKPENGK